MLSLENLVTDFLCIATDPMPSVIDPIISYVQWLASVIIFCMADTFCGTVAVGGLPVFFVMSVTAAEFCKPPKYLPTSARDDVSFQERIANVLRIVHSIL
jgi:hypothetical protein